MGLGSCYLYGYAGGEPRASLRTPCWGRGDAGAIGYFSAFPVVNLDGLVNSYDYWHAINVDRYRKPSWKGEFLPFYRELGVTHVANLQLANHWDDTILFEGTPFFSPKKVERQFRLWSVEPTEGVDPAAWFWQRVEPHFDDQAEGGGLLVDGRVAQAFARGCPPGGGGRVGLERRRAGPGTPNPGRKRKPGYAPPPPSCPLTPPLRCGLRP